MALTASRLRENIYKVLDEILQTGKPVEILRGGHLLLIVPVETGFKKGKRLGALIPRPGLKGDPEDFVHMDWSKEWKR